MSNRQIVANQLESQMLKIELLRLRESRSRKAANSSKVKKHINLYDFRSRVITYNNF